MSEVHDQELVNEAVENGEVIVANPVKIAEICGRIVGLGLWIFISILLTGGILTYYMQ